MRRVISKRIRRTGDGLDLAADINVVIATGESGTTTVASSSSRVQQGEMPATGDPGAPPTEHDDEQEE